MIGPVANSVCIVAGSILGALCGPVLSQEFRKKIMNVFSCITLGIGVTMLSKGDSLPPVVCILLTFAPNSTDLVSLPLTMGRT